MDNTDREAEFALLATILQGDKADYLECDGLIEPNDFSMPIHRGVWSVVTSMYSDGQELDRESFRIFAASNGYEYLTKSSKSQYVDTLFENSTRVKNILETCGYIKKLAIYRGLIDKYQDSLNYLNNEVGPSSKLGDVITKVESDLVNLVSGISSSNDIETIGSDIIQLNEDLIQYEPVDQLGVSTCFPIWDKLVGGGVRKAGVYLTVARPKTGKSFHAANIALSTSCDGVPTLYLDTELIRVPQQKRLVPILSGCPISLYETGKFQTQSEYVDATRHAAKNIAQLPFYYKNVSQMSFSEVLSYVRRWIFNIVGLNELGKANDCIIVYDYLKLIDGAGLSSYTPEYIQLGLMMTELQNFAIKYEVPVKAYGQVNRVGITAEDTSIVAGSDRLLWLCSALTVLSNKTEEDIELGSSWDHGNKKQKILECRYGPGHFSEIDYINLKASLKPRTDELNATGKIVEGQLHSAVTQGTKTTNVVPKQKNNPITNEG